MPKMQPKYQELIKIQTLDVRSILTGRWLDASLGWIRGCSENPQLAL